MELRYLLIFLNQLQISRVNVIPAYLDDAIEAQQVIAIDIEKCLEYDPKSKTWCEIDKDIKFDT